MTRDEPPRSAESVRVCVRCRPTNEQEASQRIAVSVDEGAQQVVLASGGSITDPPRCFTFDHVFGPKSRQEDVYVAVVADLVASVLAGVNATVFCYGQTGTGKTYTMEGTGASLSGPLLPDAGIIPRTFQQIFNAIGASQAQVTFLVCASMYEIYNEKVRDLLSKTPKNQVELHEGRDGGVYIKGLSTFLVKSQAEIGAVLEVGKRNRTVGTTLMNQDSSRSHSVFTVTVESVDAAGGGAAFRTGGDPGGSPGYGKASGIRVGKLNLVDLAGSERQSKTGAMGERLKEATKINLSLSALGNVISALVHGVDGKSGHVPYRDSKLTRLLQDSLGGNTRTVMIANVGPAASNYEETLGTLRYANRTKNIQNRPRINEDPKAKDTMMREFQDEIAKLKAQLATAGAEGSFEDDAATGSPCASKYRSPGSLIAEAAAANMQLDPEEVDRMRQQLEGELRAEHSSSGIVLSDKALAQMKEEVEVQLAEQVKQVHAEQQRAVKKATRLEQQLQQQAAQMQQVATWKNEERAHNAELSTKLHTLESKLLHGEQRGGLDELAKQTATQLSRQEEELKKERAAEAEAAQRIATLEASTYAVQSQYSSLQDEAEALGAQLEAAVAQYEVTKAEQGDVYTQWERDREDLVEEIRSLHYNLALKNLLIDAFIPQEEVSKLLQCATFNSSDGTWSLRSGSAAPPSLPKRPASAILRAGRPTSVQEGLLLELQLDIPERKMLSAPSTSITAVYSEIPLD